MRERPKGCKQQAQGKAEGQVLLEVRNQPAGVEPPRQARWTLEARHLIPVQVFALQQGGKKRCISKGESVAVRAAALPFLDSTNHSTCTDQQSRR